MNIVIVGQGAMGLLWYHHLQQLIENSAKYSNNKLQILTSKQPSAKQGKLANAQYHFTDIDAIDHQGTIKYAQVGDIDCADIIIFFVKSFQVADALTKIAAQLKSSAAIVLAHNGMGTLSELPHSVINKHNIYALLTTHGCLRTAPLTITHTGVGASDLGLLSGGIDIIQQQTLTQLLTSALPCVSYHQKIIQKQWLKLAVNCVINPLTAINNIDNGQINKDDYLPTITTLLEEIVTIAHAEGITLVLAELIKTVTTVANATAKNSSSMRCDILANRETEIDYINGYIHRLGIKHDIATPLNTKMWQTVEKIGTRF